LTDFIATKRVGSVLRSDEPLTWLQATQVLHLLNSKVGEEIDNELLALAGSFFEHDAQFVGDKAVVPDGGPSHLARGQIYHSRRVGVACEGFDLLLGLSFTVCVHLDVPFLDREPKTSQSKFWCSAIITGDPPLDDSRKEGDFALACEKVSQFAPRILERVRPLYGNAVREINPAVNAIEETGDGFSTILFQVPDSGFREDLWEIERGSKRLSDMPADTALGKLNKLYSGPFAKYYLHAGRSDLADHALSDKISVDTIVHRDRLRAQALVIETRQNDDHRFADWRSIGVTSSTEPVKHDPDKLDDAIYRLVHSPANVLSAEMAAEIGEQF
jgi:hypothetical protein